MSSLNDFRQKANQIAFASTKTLKAGNVQKAIEILHEQIQNSGNGAGELPDILQEISNAWNFVKGNTIITLLASLNLAFDELFADSENEYMLIAGYERVFTDIDSVCDLLGVDYIPYDIPSYLTVDYILIYNDIILTEFSSALEYLANRFDIEIDDSNFIEKRLIGGKFNIYEDPIGDIKFPKLENETTFMDINSIYQFYLAFSILYTMEEYRNLDNYMRSKFPVI